MGNCEILDITKYTINIIIYTCIVVVFWILTLQQPISIDKFIDLLVLAQIELGNTLLATLFQVQQCALREFSLV
jgi:dipeptide/tripeptide permease